eukprot:5999060-Pyramimonas_sp.AAC.1
MIRALTPEVGALFWDWTWRFDRTAQVRVGHAVAWGAVAFRSAEPIGPFGEILLSVRGIKAGEVYVQLKCETDGTESEKGEVYMQLKCEMDGTESEKV